MNVGCERSNQNYIELLHKLQNIIEAFKGELIHVADLRHNQTRISRMKLMPTAFKHFSG